jgi:hypothetical protein
LNVEIHSEKSSTGTSSPSRRSAGKEVEMEAYDIEGDDQDEASMSLIDTYIEGLYEEMKDKISATRKLLALARVPENQAPLIRNGESSCQ